MRILFSVATLLMTLICFAQNSDIDGIWSGELTVGQNKLGLIFNIGKNATICGMSSPDQGTGEIPGNVDLSGNDIRISISSIAAVFEGKVIGADSIAGTFHQSGYDFPLSLRPGTPKINRPQTPQPPYPYSTEEVCFTNDREDGATLHGTLAYPNNYSTSTPVVVMVTGSGLQNRNEEILEHKPFLVIADYLARNGIASLRYDDRGAGESVAKSDADEPTTESYMHDAEASIAYLRKLNKFGKTGVLGHSEGGMIAFMLGAKGDADFIVSLAAPAFRGDSILLCQNRLMMLQSGLGDTMTEEYCRSLKEIFAYKIAGRDTANYGVAYQTGVFSKLLTKAQATNLPDEAKVNLQDILNSRNKWFKYFIRTDPSEFIAKTKCPVMAINGALDTQVDADNLTEIGRLLPDNDHNLLKEYPRLNHLFQHCTTGRSTEYRRIEETISPDVLSDIVNWIHALK